MAEVLQRFYCAGYDGRLYPVPLRMIENARQRQYAREAYHEGKKDYVRQENYLRMTGQIK